MGLKKNLPSFSYCKRSQVNPFTQFQTEDFKIARERMNKSFLTRKKGRWRKRSPLLYSKSCHFLKEKTSGIHIPVCLPQKSKVTRYEQKKMGIRKSLLRKKKLSSVKNRCKVVSHSLAIRLKPKNRLKIYHSLDNYESLFFLCPGNALSRRSGTIDTRPCGIADGQATDRHGNNFFFFVGQNCDERVFGNETPSTTRYFNFLFFQQI